VLGWGLWLLYTALLGALYSQLPPNPDQQIFDYIGWVGLNGGKFYIDVVEQNLPGEMLLHELSTWLFGNRIWSYRVLDYAWMLLVGGGALFALCRLAGRRREAYLAVPLYQAMYVTSTWWFAGQRDIVAAHLLLAVGAALIWRERGGGWGWLVAIALGLVGAMLIRPTYVIFSFALLAHDVFWSHARSRAGKGVAIDLGVVAGIILLAAAAILLFAWRQGALQVWYDSVVQYSTHNYRPSFAAMSAQFFGFASGWHWYVGFAALGAVAWWRHHIGRDVLGMLAGLVATSLISAYGQGKGFGYHLGAILPSLAIPIAACLSMAFESWKARRTTPRLLLAAIVILIAVLGLGRKLEHNLGPQIQWLIGRTPRQSMLASGESGIDGSTAADLVAAADFVQRTTTESATLLTVPRPVGVNFLSRRRSPSRFITFGMLTTIDQRLPVARKWSAEFAQMMSTAPPELVLVPGPGSGQEYEQFWKAPAAPAPIQVLRHALATRYGLDRRFGSMDFYRLAKTGRK